MTGKQVAMVAAYATQQGSEPTKSAWAQGADAFRGALRESGIGRDAVDGLVTMMSQDGSKQMESARFGQIVGVNPRASASLNYGGGPFSLGYAMALIQSGQASVVACVYGTNQRSSRFRFANPLDPFAAPYGFLNPAGFAALGFQRYLYKYNRLADRDKIGAVAIAQRKHAQLNPIAFRREPMTWDDYLNDRWIVWPLRRADVCLINDGGVCIILTDAERAGEFTDRPVYVRGYGRQDSLGRLANEEHLLVPHMRIAARQVVESSGFGPGDVDALYVQDAHSAVVAMTLENYGYCGPGEALDFIQDGRIELGGAMPINTNGGQLSEGYLIGWLHNVEIFRQLRGECGERQVADCNVAQFCGTGGFREYAVSFMYSNQSG